MKSNRRWCALALAPALVVVIGLVLAAISPWRQPGPISRLQIGTTYATAAAFDGRALTCDVAELDQTPGDTFRLLANCTIAIAGDPLTIAVDHRGVIGECSALYRGRTLPCSSAIPFYNAAVPAIFVQDDLGMTSAELRRLPGTNPLFYISEGAWFWIVCALAALVTLLTVLAFVRASPHSTRWSWVARATTLLGSAALLAVVWYGLLFALLLSGFVD